MNRKLKYWNKNKEELNRRRRGKYMGCLATSSETIKMLKDVIKSVEKKKMSSEKKLMSSESSIETVKVDCYDNGW